jgi:hypothetical protein
MTPQERKVMEQALEALEHSHATEPMWKTPIKNAIASILQAIAEAEKQEPMIFHVHKLAIEENDFKEHVNFYRGTAPSEDFVTLYTHPPKQKPLTDEQLREIENKINPNMRWRSSDEEGITLYPSEYYDLVKAIEAAHGIKEEA